MAEKIKYNTKDPKYFDVKNLAKFLTKECSGKNVKIKFEKGKDGSKDALKITGNPAKIAGALPDGWSYDPHTNKFRNGNKAEAEYIDVKPLKPAKPLKNIVDMSDVMYVIKCKKPELKLKALDTTTFGLDGGTISNIDWKGIFGSKFKFDKSTGTIQGETNEGIKLAFNVLSEKFEDRKFETVSENKYTSNTEGIMSSGFSAGNRKSVEHTADYLLTTLSSLDSTKLLHDANMEAFDVAEARFLFNTCNLVPNPRGEGLAVQERETGVIYTDPQKVARLAIVYNLTELVNGQNTAENNPLLDTVTRGEVNWENFDGVFNGFSENPEVLGEVMSVVSDGLGQGDRRVQEDVAKTVEEVQTEQEGLQETPTEAEIKEAEEILEGETNSAESSTEETSENAETAIVAGNVEIKMMSATTQMEDAIKLKCDGGEVNHLNIGDDKNPMSFDQLMSLGQKYELILDNGEIKGVYLKENGEMVNTSSVDLLISWLLVKDALMQLPNSKEYWDNIIAKGNWQEVAADMSLSAKNQMAMASEMEDENVMEMKNVNNGDNATNS